MKLFQLSVVSFVWRLYLMMAIVVISGFTGLWFISILALPVFFSALIGMQFQKHIDIAGSKRKVIQHSSSHQHLAH
jgi:hypothetical protein